MTSAGFLLVDASFRPVYASPESVKILNYPDDAPSAASLEGLLTQKILSFLPRDFPQTQDVFITNIQSGRRRYHCRAFVLGGQQNANARERRIALLLERGLPTLLGNAMKHGKFGGMNGDPFSYAPDPRYYYFSRAHREIFASLRAMVREGRGIGVLLARAGMGKSVFLNYFAEKLHDESDVVKISGSFESGAEIVRRVMSLLGVREVGSDLSENLRRFEACLLSERRAERGITLIFDEAQYLTIDALEKLSRLADVKTSPRQRIQIVLAGRQELLEKLNSAQLEDVSKKTDLFCRLIPLDEAEVCSYILHRLGVAGCTRQLFSSGALSAIGLYSRGIPLNINMLCRHALSIAASVNLKLIDERIIADSAYDLVLSAQPFTGDETPIASNLNQRPRSALLRDRRGLRLVKKL